MLCSDSANGWISKREKKIMGRVSDAKERLMEAVLELIWTGSFGTTTIDHICEKAGVKKGSFYYFFDSKGDLAVTAIDSDWPRHRAELDSIFSATVPPLERLRKYCDTAIRDAHAAGLLHAPDAAAKSRLLFAYYQGLVTQARIQDNLEIPREAVCGTWDLLGVKQEEA